MTWQELEQLGRRYGFSPTLRKRTTKRGTTRAYIYLSRWVADGTRPGKTTTVYLCPFERLEDITDEQVYAKLGKLPDRPNRDQPVTIVYLPGGALELRRGGTSLVLFPEDLDYIREALQQRERSEC